MHRTDVDVDLKYGGFGDVSERTLAPLGVIDYALVTESTEMPT